MQRIVGEQPPPPPTAMAPAHRTPARSAALPMSRTATEASWAEEMAATVQQVPAFVKMMMMRVRLYKLFHDASRYILNL
ncbi:hypothetical protein TomMM35A_01380 [Sphingobium sp. TomMM35A]